jgi:hypothetical protein
MLATLIKEYKMKIKTIRSGGQTGVDRAALDAARQQGVAIAGWCPKNGLAEDCPEPPGVAGKYPELRETNYPGHSQRTVLNIWDADATLIFCLQSGELSPGTKLTIKIAKKIKKPFYILRGGGSEIIKFIEWLNQNFDDEIELNVAGPRESSQPGVYKKARKIIVQLLEQVGLN